MTTESAVTEALLAGVRRQFTGCRHRIHHCLEQLSDEQIWWRSGEAFNSIANLLLHLDGNICQRMLSLIGGEPDQRDRDREFSERGPIPKRDLLERFDETLNQTDRLLASLPAEKLLEPRRYRLLKGDTDGTVLTVIMHTLVHLAGHTQEVIAFTRLILREQYCFMQGAPTPPAKT